MGMGVSRRCLGFVLGVVSVFAGARDAESQVTYTYTGKDFTSAFGGPYSTSDFISASVTFTSSLPDNLDLTNESSSIISWSITDQNVVFDSADDTLNTAEFGTNANGVIDEWYFATENSAQDQLATVNENGSVDDVSFMDVTGQFDGNNVYSQGGIIINDPGNWALSTPEPSTVVMALLGGATLLIRWREQA